MSPPPPRSGWEAYLVDSGTVPSHAAWSLGLLTKDARVVATMTCPPCPEGHWAAGWCPGPEAGSDCHIRYRKCLLGACWRGEGAPKHRK